MAEYIKNKTLSKKAEEALKDGLPDKTKLTNIKYEKAVKARILKDQDQMNAGKFQDFIYEGEYALSIEANRPLTTVRVYTDKDNKQVFIRYHPFLTDEEREQQRIENEQIARRIRERNAQRRLEQERQRKEEEEERQRKEEEEERQRKEEEHQRKEQDIYLNAKMPVNNSSTSRVVRSNRESYPNQPLWHGGKGKRKTKKTSKGRKSKKARKVRKSKKARKARKY